MSFKKYRDIILGAVMLVFSGFYLTVAQGIKTRPKLTPAYASAKIVPILLGVLLAILAVICIIEGVYKMKKYGTTMTNEKAGSAQAAGDAFAVLATFALMIVYALALPVAAALAASPQLLNLAKDAVEAVFGAAWISKWAGDWLVALIDWQVFRMAFSFIMSSLVFAVFFKVMPNRKVRFRYALWGGVLSSLMFVSWLKACAVAQVGIAKSSALYGSFAFFPIVLAWMYVSWEIVLLGANMVRAFECVCSEKE